MLAIETKNLTKKYKDVIAVDNLNLYINKGELFSLLGINGAGKTTTIKMLSCLTKPTSGDAFIFGKSIFNNHDIKSIIAVSFQETAIASYLTVKENLSLMCNIYKFSNEKKQSKIDEIVNKLGLESVITKKAGKLSGGYKRRLSIAMALITEPEILFLDEPTLGLDVIARRELWDIIIKFKGKITIVLTTHYMEEAEELSDRIGIMKEGKMLICDTINNIKEITNEINFEKAFIKIIRGE